MVSLAKKGLTTSTTMQGAANSVAAPVDGVGYVPLVNVSLMCSTGSTLLNLAMTDDPYGGWPMSRMCNLIGDSSSGKTFLYLSSLAEAANNPKFDDYLLIYDDVEFAMTFDIPRLFGRKLAARLCAPYYLNKKPVYSTTIEQCWGFISALLASGRPFIYGLDSVDALSTNAAQTRAQNNAKAQVKAVDKQEDPAALEGSYGVEKPKILSNMLQDITSELSRTNSAFIAISQTRDNINPLTARMVPKTRSGGRALKFYATHEMWLAHKENIQHAGTKRKIGDLTIAKVTKNKVTGKQRNVPLSLYYDYGVDDITQCVSFLVENGALAMEKQTIQGMELFGVNGTMATLVKVIEENPEYLHKLRVETGRAWNAIEEAIKLHRKPRYE